ncbi:MAG: M20/M25/M40 family metallo-hydrolase [Caldithrix sp.]|nr:MAG: M20/M25/M40 family metallo-hydrolase [Caldithrix sp.]
MKFYRKMMKYRVLYIFLTSVALISEGWSQSGFDQKIADLIQQVSQDSLSKHIESLTFAGGHETRVSFTEGNRWSAEYIKAMFDSFSGLTSVEFDTFFVPAIAPFNSEPLVNIIATLEGCENPNQIYVIGGHMDATANLDLTLNWNSDWPTAKAPGADDNASGIAAILETARILSDPLNEFAPATTLNFIAFGAEEQHPAYFDNNHMGSKHYVLNAYAGGIDIVGAYIVDMVGHNSTGNNYYNIVSNGKSEHLGQRLIDANSAYQIGLTSNSPPFSEPTYSDHFEFWQYRYNAVLLIENAPPWQNNSPWYIANPFYHRQSDTYATLNMSQVHKIAQLVLATVASLPSPVTSIKSPEKLPLDFTLFQNYPNPFNAGTRINYQLQSPGKVDLAVYNLQGQKIVRLVDDIQSSGEHAAVWDGKNKQGRRLPSGVYLYRLRAGGRQVVYKMILSN